MEKKMDEDRRKETILIVDNTLAAIDLIKTVLEGQGYDIMVATSGEKAIKITGLKTPDLILLDVLMPGMDGYETCRLLKAEERTREVPVIFMTALGSTESKITGFEAGAVDYVTKPIEIEEVLARVKTHLSLRNLQRELEMQNRLLQQKIVEHQQAEEEIRILNLELEQRVEDRTAELMQANEQLIKEVEERKRAEEALRTSEERYRALYENNPSMYFTVGADGMVLSVNPFGAEQLGYTAEELTGQSVLKMFHPDDRDAVRQKLKECLKKRGQVEQWIFRKIRKDGSPLWVEEYARAVVDSGGVLHALVVCNDITARKLGEEALQESEERYRTAIESCNDGVAIVEEDRYAYVNQRFAEIFGHDRPEEIIGEPLSIVLHPDDRDRVIRFNRLRIDGTSVPSRYEFKGRRKDGKEVLVEVSAARTTYRGKNVSLSFHRDITQRKQLQAQLQRVQKMEAIGTLAGGIAHDFNNILAIIIGCTELLLLTHGKDSRSLGHLKQIHEAANRATDLIQQILTFSRQRKVEKKPLQLNFIVKEVLKMLRASLPSTIQIDQNIAPDSGMTLADPTQIHQVIMNLCTNAAHAMREHGGVLKISLSDIDINSGNLDSYPEVGPGAYLRLSVSDTGHGMNRDVLERIFDPYFTTKESGEGTGLGLAVIHGIVDNYKGVIRVQSEPDKGTTFEIFLPSIDHPSEMEDIEDCYKDLPLGHERILFVDDEQAIVNVSKEMLEILGYEVVTTTSSVDALKLFRDQPDHFDLIITDMTMPYMTGDTLAGEILRIRPDMPVILCTGFIERSTEIKAKALGIQEYVAKPMVIHELAEKVRDALDRGKSKIEK
jgi:PAS domain S-box-containing protein